MTTPSQSKDAEFVKRIENLEAQVESIMADAKSEAADIRLDIKEVLKEAKADLMAAAAVGKNADAPVGEAPKSKPGA